MACIVLLVGMVAAGQLSDGDNAADVDAVTANVPDAEEFGPVVVINKPPSPSYALFEGAISIDKECVSLSIDTGGRVTLLWPADSTSWNGESRSITYDRSGPDHPRIEVADGDRVQISGGALDTESAADVREPHADCPTGQAIHIGAIRAAPGDTEDGEDGP